MAAARAPPRSEPQNSQGLGHEGDATQSTVGGRLHRRNRHAAGSRQVCALRR